MAVKQLSYTTEQVDDALLKKDLLQDVSAVNATPGDVADTATFVDIDGPHKGTLKNLKAKEYSFGAAEQTIASGSIITQDQTINKLITQTKTVSIDTADQNIKPDTGKVLTKVIVNRLPTDAIGSKYEEIEDQTVVPTVYDIDLVPDGVVNKYLRNNRVIISGDKNLRSENIKKDVTIFGVTGSYEKDPDMEYPAPDGKRLSTYGLVGNYDWTSVAYGNGKFVASSGTLYRVAYSEDGVSWSYANVSVPLIKVAYGNGMFVGISGNSTNSMMSTDGINWELSNMPQSLQYTDIVYGNGVFVTIAYNSNMGAYTENGIDWSTCYLSDISNWKSICFGNGKFVAVTYDSKGIINISTDGINWEKTSGPSDSDDDYYAVEYGNGTYVAIANTASTAIYSTDGTNWQKTTIPYAYWTDLTFGNGRFVAVCNPNGGYNRSMWSTDGIMWTNGTISEAATWQGVAYGAGKFLAVGRANSNSIESCYSLDGESWIQAETIASNTDWRCVAYGDNKYVAIGAGTTPTLSKSNLISYSYDGVNWTSALITGNIKWNSVIYCNNKFVAVGSNVDSVTTSSSNKTPLAYSYDGINWYQLASTDALSEEGVVLNHLAYGNGKIVAVGPDVSLYSNDGIKWVAGGATMVGCKDICFGKNTFVCVSNMAIAYSSDSINWSQCAPPAGMTIHAVTYGGNKFVAIGNNTADANIIMYAVSTDGVTWTSGNNTAFEVDKPITFNSITYGNGKFLAVGSNGDKDSKAVYSINGTVWYLVETNSVSDLTSVTRGPNMFLSIGRNSSITLNSYTTNNYTSETPPIMNAPSVTIQSAYLNITPVSGAKGYLIHLVGDSEIRYGLYTESLRVTLSDYLTEPGSYSIFVRTCGPKSLRSNTTYVNYVIS